MAKRSAPSRPAPRVLRDPRAIRALAHPARLAVLDALGNGVELTATQCAEIAGTSPSAMSYHLRALEKWGIVERVESAGDARLRPWRAYPGGWSVDSLPDAATASATSTVTGILMGRVTGEMAAWFAHERVEPEQWQTASGLSSHGYWLTAAEVAELQALHRGYLAERDERTPADRPNGSRRVRVTQLVIPLDVGDESAD